MLFVARLVDGLSGGNISTARAYVADITTEDERAKAYGLIGAAFGIGFVLGPALSGVFAHISYTAPIWAAAAITLVATVLAWAWLPETVHRGAADPGPFWGGLRGAFQRPDAAPPAGRRPDLLVGVRGLPGHVRALLRAALRLRRAAHRIRAERLRRPRRARPGGAGPARRREARRAARVRARPAAGGDRLGWRRAGAQRAALPAVARARRRSAAACARRR